MKKYRAYVMQDGRFVRVLVQTNSAQLAERAADMFNTHHQGRHPDDPRTAQWGRIEKDPQKRKCPVSHAPCEFYKVCCEEGMSCYIKATTVK